MAEFPAHIEIELTNRCMLACPMCPHRKMKREQGDMTWDTLKKVVAQVFGRGAKTCYMHMIGEPLLHRDLAPMIDYVSFEAGLRTSISTNGMLLDEHTAERLLIGELDELTLALDSLKPQVYQTMRPGGDFARVKANIDRTIEQHRKLGSDCRLELQMIVTRDNAGEVAAFEAEYLPKLEGVGELLVKGYSTFAGAVADLAPQPTPPRRYSCPKLHTSTAVLWNGDVVVCCRDYEGVTRVGNVHETPLAELWRSAAYKRYRAAHQARDWDTLELCRDC